MADLPVHVTLPSQILSRGIKSFLNSMQRLLFHFVHFTYFKYKVSCTLFYSADVKDTQ